VLKTSDIIENLIYPVGQDNHIGGVRDVIIDMHANCLLGLLIGHGGWSGGTRVLPWSEIVQINFRRIIVKSTDSVVLASTISPIRHILEQGQQPIGADIVTADNRRLGTLTDVFFDSQTGEIAGYEMSDGAKAGIYAPWRSFVPSAAPSMKFRDDTLVVPQAVVDQMQIRPGPNDPANNTAVALLGRRVRWNVRAGDGEIIAARGQIVDHDIINQAREQDMVKVLRRAIASK
jgi:uncharacterized protein YrrD